MTDTHDARRRTVLQTIGAAGLAGGLSTAATAEAPTTRVVEAGLRFDVPDAESFERVRPDSRPPYTVEEDPGRLLVLNTASQTDRRHIRSGSELANERSVQTGTTVTVGPRDGRVGALPTALSSRMRATEAVQLTDSLRVPTATLHPTGDGVSLAAQSVGTTELPVGEPTTLELPSVTASVRTSEIVGTADVADDVPEFMVGVEREYGSETVSVTPVVEAVNRGTLPIAQQPDPPANAPDE